MRLRAHTGPVGVKDVADKLRAAGVSVHCEGTEHVYIDVPAGDHYQRAHDVAESMRKAHGTTLGLKWTGV